MCNNSETLLCDSLSKKIASEMPVPHRNIFNTMRYRSTASVQSSGYFQSTVSYIKFQTMFNACTLYLHLAGPNYGLDVLNITMHTEVVIHSMNAYVWCWS